MHMFWFYLSAMTTAAAAAISMMHTRYTYVRVDWTSRSLHTRVIMKYKWNAFGVLVRNFSCECWPTDDCFYIFSILIFIFFSIVVRRTMTNSGQLIGKWCVAVRAGPVTDTSTDKNEGLFKFFFFSWIFSNGLPSTFRSISKLSTFNFPHDRHTHSHPIIGNINLTPNNILSWFFIGGTRHLASIRKKTYATREEKGKKVKKPATTTWNHLNGRVCRIRIFMIFSPFLNAEPARRQQNSATHVMGTHCFRRFSREHTVFVFFCCCRCRLSAAN